MLDASPALDLPPPYRLVTLREIGDAHGHACAIAAAAGAGTFVWARRYDVLDIAVVLEPDEPLAMARRAFFVGMTALADALAAHCPPERALGFDWPDTIKLNGARIGGGRLGWPESCREKDSPAWLVFSAMLMVAQADPEQATGARWTTSFEDEGFGPRAVESVAESFARQLLLSFDRYESEGFAPIAAHYLGHLGGAADGVRRSIGAHGDLLIAAENRRGKRERHTLARALGTPAWLDPETGSVRP